MWGDVGQEIVSRVPVEDVWREPGEGESVPKVTAIEPSLMQTPCFLLWPAFCWSLVYFDFFNVYAIILYIQVA